MDVQMEKKTPLYDVHVKNGGKMVSFGGYLLPIQYQSGILTEHMAVREAVGMFDVSHMGELVIEGKDALANVQMIATNECGNMKDGQVKYSPMCNDRGGVIDDLLVYRKSEECYMLVVNAANHDKDVAWIQSHLTGNVTFTDESDETALFAIQGPCALALIESIVEEKDIPQKPYTFVDHVSMFGAHVLLSRTGYTGEDGFEIYLGAQDAVHVFENIISKGAEFGLILCGLGARDTLRLEAAMPLYGHEMDEDTDPITAGLKMFVKLDKDFYGRDALKDKEIIKKRVGLMLLDKGIAREGTLVFDGDTEVGKVSSGTLGPCVNKAIAMASVDSSVTLGQKLIVDVRGRKLNAEVVKLPFYKKGDK